MNAYLRRIENVNPLINAIVDVNKNALLEAEALDKLIERHIKCEVCTNDESVENKPLLGIPVSIKDSIAVKGLLFTGGLYARRNTIADQDSDVVTNIRKSGAIPIVITNVPDLLMWSDTNSVLVSETHNPYDLSKTPGGSSGGEGALIASAGSVIGI
ncbi:fatty-acid amide hydrolase 2-B-like protein, partial [Leptotrombidium deliense]